MDFSKLNGLVPAVIQDDGTNEVLMVGFMNDAALKLTRETGYVTFYSRTRARLWTKGESSGNRLRVKTILSDCDNDTVLVRVAREGEGLVCHLGTVTCFTQSLTNAGSSDPARRSGAGRRGPRERGRAGVRRAAGPRLKIEAGSLDAAAPTCL